MPRSYRYYYKVGIDPETRPALAEIAGELGFVNLVPGAAQGEPSPASLLDSLAGAYRADPARVLTTLRAIGVEAEAQPEEKRP
jgi:hypothetical protein